jgi:predicted acetyltransferase
VARLGRWQVGQMTANQAAQAFWRRTIAACTGGRFTEEVLASGWWQGVVQCFEIAASVDNRPSEPPAQPALTPP